MTSTKTPIETLPYDKALKLVSDAMQPYLGAEIGNGWVFNGGIPYVTAKGKLLYNLTIQPDHYMNLVEEAESFHDSGIEVVLEFLSHLGIMEIAHYVVRQEDEALAERLRAL